jgi:hypothetical protein
MNQSGLAFALTGVSTALKMNAWFEGIVTGGQIKKDELDGSSQLAAALATKVRDASSERIEPLVAQYNDVLTKHWESFEAKKDPDPLGALHEAQIMIGTVTMILEQSNIFSAALD